METQVQKIRAENERRMSYWWDKLPDADSDDKTWTQAEVKALGAYMEAENLLDFIDSLPEQQIDLEEEIIKYWKDISSLCGPIGKEITHFDFEDACKYFYELGKNGK